jgi:hypothetical protein
VGGRVGARIRGGAAAAAVNHKVSVAVS